MISDQTVLNMIVIELAILMVCLCVCVFLLNIFAWNYADLVGILPHVGAVVITKLVLVVALMIMTVIVIGNGQISL